LRKMSATGTPTRPCFHMNAFWASENCEAFIAALLPAWGLAPETLTANDPV
jgi:hypothetical protein